MAATGAAWCPVSAALTDFVVGPRRGRTVSHAEYFANCQPPDGWLFKDLELQHPLSGQGFHLRDALHVSCRRERHPTQEPGPGRVPALRTARGRWRGRASGRGRGPSVSERSEASSHLCPAGGGSFPAPALASPTAPQPGQLRPSPRTGPWAAGTPRRALSARSSRLPQEGTSSRRRPESLPPRAGPQGWAWRWCSAGVQGTGVCCKLVPRTRRSPLVLLIESQREWHLLPDPLKRTAAHSVTSHVWFSP